MLDRPVPGKGLGSGPVMVVMGDQIAEEGGHFRDVAHCQTDAAGRQMQGVAANRCQKIDARVFQLRKGTMICTGDRKADACAVLMQLEERGDGFGCLTAVTVPENSRKLADWFAASIKLLALDAQKGTGRNFARAPQSNDGVLAFRRASETDRS